MRDLARERTHPNGAPGDDEADAALLLEPEPPRASPSRDLREARQDQNLAAIAGLIVRAAQVLEPVVEILSRRLLGWVALGAAVAMAFYALRGPLPPVPTSYDDGLVFALVVLARGVVVVAFMVLAPFMIRRV